MVMIRMELSTLHKTNNPVQTRMFNKEQKSTHRQLNSFGGLLLGYWCRTNRTLVDNLWNKSEK